MLTIIAYAVIGQCTWHLIGLLGSIIDLRESRSGDV